MKKQFSKTGILLVMAGTVFILSSANFIYQTAKKYYAVCGKCGWVSPSTSSHSNAGDMRYNHVSDNSGHRASVIVFDSNQKKTFKAVCGKCSWVSPSTTSHSNAGDMRYDHVMSNSGHSASVREE
jgi:hypothetical protein